jgi:VIT1/CCC1 family predicted Fe2+/Mn2+ transporter
MLCWKDSNTLTRQVDQVAMLYMHSIRVLYSHTSSSCSCTCSWCSSIENSLLCKEPAPPVGDCSAPPPGAPSSAIEGGTTTRELPCMHALAVAVAVVAVLVSSVLSSRAAAVVAVVLAAVVPSAPAVVVVLAVLVVLVTVAVVAMSSMQLPRRPHSIGCCAACVAATCALACAALHTCYVRNSESVRKC